MAKTKRLSVLESGRVLYLPAARIRPNPLQPRKHFDAGALQELAEMTEPPLTKSAMNHRMRKIIAYSKQ